MVIEIPLPRWATFDGAIGAPVVAGQAVFAVVLPGWSAIFHDDIAYWADLLADSTTIALLVADEAFVEQFGHLLDTRARRCSGPFPEVLV